MWRGLVLFQILFGFVNVAQAQLSSPLSEELVNSPLPAKITRTRGKVYIGPDPSLVMDRFQQLRDPAFRDALGLTEAEIRSYQIKAHSFVRDLAEVKKKERDEQVPKGSTKILYGEQIDEAAAFLDEFLSPDQKTRFDQLLFRMEAHWLGLGEALVNGRLSLAVGVHEQQSDQLLRKAEEIEKELNEAIIRLRQEAESKLLAELTPEQRDRAKKKLGEPFYYTMPKTSSQKIYYKIRDETQKALNGGNGPR